MDHFSDGGAGSGYWCSTGCITVSRFGVALLVVSEVYYHNYDVEDQIFNSQIMH